jgi:hypothetical protein
VNTEELQCVGRQRREVGCTDSGQQRKIFFKIRGTFCGGGVRLNKFELFYARQRSARRGPSILKSERFGQAIAEGRAMLGLALRVVEEGIVERFAVMQEQALAQGIALK